MWHDEKLKHVQLDLLRELQRDVVQSIADIKQKIADIETRQSEAVREVSQVQQLHRQLLHFIIWDPRMELRVGPGLGTSSNKQCQGGAQEEH